LSGDKGLLVAVETLTDPTSPKSSLGYGLFDADNHYYETEDAFLRFADPAFAHRAPRWVQTEDGSRRLVFGDRMNRYLGADHTFSMVGKPGSLHQGSASSAVQKRSNLGPPMPEFQQRDARVEWMNGQGLASSLVFPTLGLSVEALLVDDVTSTYSNLHAFNRWIDDQWGFNFNDRIYGAPLISLLDPARAVEELEFVLARGARAILLRYGPIAGRSPSDPIYDRFWSMVADAGVAVIYHSADNGLRWEMAQIWGWGNVNVPARNIPPLQRLIASHERSIHDTIATLIYGKLFERFPTLRFAAIELGSSWVGDLVDSFERVGKGDLDVEPIETFKKHFWVTPFEDDDIRSLADTIGIDRLMFGSDYPHTDGLAEPAKFAEYLEGFGPDEVRKIMHDNARGLLSPKAVG